MEIRATTRQAFEVLRASGAIPSVRKVYAQIGGSYNFVAAEVHALRVEVTTCPAPSAPVASDVQETLSRADSLPGESHPLVTVPPVAVHNLITALRENRRLYHDLVLWCRRIQLTKHGPLTDFLAALTGLEEKERIEA